MQVKFEPEAEADLAQARVWYGRQRAGLDLELMLRVDETLQRIVNAPYSYRVVHRQLRSALLRQFPLAILYQQFINKFGFFAFYHPRRNGKKRTRRVRKKPGL